MKSTSAVLGLIFWLCFCAGVCGDEVIFTNGDRLTGTIKHMTKGKMVLETDVAGEITVDMSKVKTFSTRQVSEMHLKDARVLNKQIRKAETGRVAVADEEFGQKLEIFLESISAIKPPPKPEPKWHGEISAGISSTHGNTRTENRNLSGKISRRGEDDRITVSGDYARGKQEAPGTGEQEVTENWWRMTGKYDYFLNKKVYLYGQGRYEKDSIAELDRRTTIGGGGGYQWIESEDINLNTEAGIASIYEKFDDQTDNNREIAVQMGYHFDARLLENIKFVNDLTYYPVADELSDYYLTSTTELRADITKNFFANLRIIFDYDDTPADGADKTDVKYLAGAGWSF